MKRVYILWVVLMLTGVMLIFNINYASYSVYEHTKPGLSLDIASSQLEDVILDGDIIIDFKGPIRADTLLEVNVDNDDYSVTIEDMLNELDVNFEKTQDTKKLVNSSTSKLLVFDESESKELGFKLPRDVTLSSLSMKITGASYNNVYPEAVSLDFNGFIWKYLGSFDGWNSTFYFIEELESDNLIRQDTLMEGEKNYCTLLELPYSKDYRVYVEYKADNSNEDIVAGIYSNFYENLGDCVLPNPSNFYQWNYCDINLEEVNFGSSLICVSTNESRDYKLSTGQVANDDTFMCDSNMNCEPINHAAYFVKAQSGNYVFNSTSPVIVEEDQNGLLLNAIQNSLGSCNYGDDYYCIIPFNVWLNTAGRIVLDDLGIVYQSIVYNVFYDVLEEESIIHGVNNRDISSENISFPLSYFNISLGKGNYELEISFDDIEKSKDIMIRNDTRQYKDIENLIDSTSGLIDGLIGNEILQLLGYNFDDKDSQLNALVSEFNTMKLSNDSSYKQNKANQIKTSLDNLKNNLDVSVSESKLVRDRFVAEPKDVEDLGLNEDIYLQQRNYNVNFEAKLVKVEDSTGVRDYSLFKKTINGNYNVYEVIPKNLVSDVSSVSFKVMPEVIKADPIVKFSNVNEIIYFVEGDKVNEVYNTKTIIEAGEIIGDGYGEDVCGDGVCGVMEDEESCPEDCGGFNIPWIWVILIIIVFLIGVGYILFYRGRFDLRTIGKRPIKSGKSLESLVSFISHSNMKKDELSKLLLARGWEAEQIKFAFDEVEWRKKKVLIKTPESKKNDDVLVNFIKKNLDAHVSWPRIRSSLLSKGWKEEQINEALREVKN